MSLNCMDFLPNSVRQAGFETSTQLPQLRLQWASSQKRAHPVDALARLANEQSTKIILIIGDIIFYAAKISISQLI